MCQNDPPNKCAKMTRQNILAWQPAGFTRENNPPNLLAQKNLPFQLAACLPKIPPSLLKIPRLDPARQPSPPPPAAPPTEQGGGGRDPAPPTHAY